MNDEVPVRSVAVRVSRRRGGFWRMPNVIFRLADLSLAFALLTIGKGVQHACNLARVHASRLLLNVASLHFCSAQVVRFTRRGTENHYRCASIFPRIGATARASRRERFR